MRYVDMRKDLFISLNISILLTVSMLLKIATVFRCNLKSRSLILLHCWISRFCRLYSLCYAKWIYLSIYIIQWNHDFIDNLGFIDLSLTTNYSINRDFTVQQILVLICNECTKFLKIVQFKKWKWILNCDIINL